MRTSLLRRYKQPESHPSAAGKTVNNFSAAKPAGRFQVKRVSYTCCEDPRGFRSACIRHNLEETVVLARLSAVREQNSPAGRTDTANRPQNSLTQKDLRGCCCSPFEENSFVLKRDIQSDKICSDVSPRKGPFFKYTYARARCKKKHWRLRELNPQSWVNIRRCAVG
jgi:hypothetical protein